jgi:hypothetical protein
MKGVAVMMTEINAGEELTEVVPGFFETRRRIICLPASLAALALLGRGDKASAGTSLQMQSGTMARPSSSSGQIEWDSFLKDCVQVAEQLHKDSSAAGQEAYLHWIASMISRTRTGSIPRAKVGRFGTLEPALRFGVSYRGRPFFVVEWQLEPGAFLPPHCHPNASVCTVGIEGEARIRNFEIVGKAPEFASSESFRVRQTHDEIISAGRINTLSARRDNIHTFQAGKNGAWGIDISSYHGPDVGFSFLELSGKPVEAEGRIFEASWTGKSYGR